MAQFGLEPTLISSGMTGRGGRAAMAQFLVSGGRAPTTIFAHNNLTAIGVMLDRLGGVGGPAVTRELEPDLAGPPLLRTTRRQVYHGPNRRSGLLCCFPGDLDRPPCQQRFLRRIGNPGCCYGVLRCAGVFPLPLRELDKCRHFGPVSLVEPLSKSLMRLPCREVHATFG